MDKAVFDKILTAQEKLSYDQGYHALIEEYARLQDRFLEQVETMNEEQRSAVWDYCGMLIEMHLHTLKIVAL